MQSIKSTLLRQAEGFLRDKDPVLASLIEKYGPCTLRQTRRDPFHVLCSSIIGQQLSSKAADTIQNRVMAKVAEPKRLKPEQLLRISHDELRACGLSNAKANWLRSISAQVHSGDFSFRRLQRMSDEEATAALDALPGVGLWTAEMYLIFALQRMDIFSMGDVGLRRSMDRLYNRGKKLSDARTLKITRQWAPHRSVASWYLWRLADGDVQTWT